MYRISPGFSLAYDSMSSKLSPHGAPARETITYGTDSVRATVFSDSIETPRSLATGVASRSMVEPGRVTTAIR
jgi:hypothetical protein